jgi:exopolysaccharide production protein ExoQ
MVLIGSRFPSEWLAGPGVASTDTYLEGNSIDRNVFLALIGLGFLVLVKRRVAFRIVLRNNVWVVLFFTYTALSLLWSDFPLIAFKRWHKVLGHVVMVLVVLTEEDPTRAVEALFRRCTYVLVPMSVVLIKYFPAMSRAFDEWTGEAANIGITTNKNLLGNVCMITGLFFVAVLSSGSRRDGAGKLDRLAEIAVAGMIVWLLDLADSATSMVCLVLGSTVIVAARVRPVARRLSVIMIVLAVTAGIVVFSGLQDIVLAGLGRDSTLTGRTELWAMLREIPVNPVIGVGFESFWLGDRVEGLWKKYWWKPNQAHNGYYEMYLNLGYVGVVLQLAMILVAYSIATKRMKIAVRGGPGDAADFALARFNAGYMVALVAYNFTEATFKALHLSFFVFFLAAVHYPRSQLKAGAVELERKKMRATSFMPASSLAWRPQPLSMNATEPAGRASRRSPRSVDLQWFDAVRVRRQD